MNRIAIANLSEVRALARADMAETLGGILLPFPVPDRIKKVRECLKKAKTLRERLRCLRRPLSR